MGKNQLDDPAMSLTSNPRKRWIGFTLRLINKNESSRVIP
jgi:hypothetical protein